MVVRLYTGGTDDDPVWICKGAALRLAGADIAPKPGDAGLSFIDFDRGDDFEQTKKLICLFILNYFEICPDNYILCIIDIDDRKSEFIVILLVV